MNPCSYFEGNPAFTQPLLYQKLTVVSDPALFVSGVSMCKRLTWLFTYEHRGGRDRIRNNELDGCHGTVKNDEEQGLGPNAGKQVF